MHFYFHKTCFGAQLNSLNVCGPHVCGLHVFVYVCFCAYQGYTLAEEEEDPLIFQHRQVRGNQGDALVSGPVEAGPMKKLHVSTTALQKVGRNSWHFFPPWLKTRTRPMFISVAVLQVFLFCTASSAESRSSIVVRMYESTNWW